MQPYKKSGTLHFLLAKVVSMSYRMTKANKSSKHYFNARRTGGAFSCRLTQSFLAAREVRSCVSHPLAQSLTPMRLHPSPPMAGQGQNTTQRRFYRLALSFSVMAQSIRASSSSHDEGARSTGGDIAAPNAAPKSSLIGVTPFLNGMQKRLGFASPTL